MSRGRKLIAVTAEGLQTCVKEVEAMAGGAFPSRSALWSAVANTEYARKLSLTSQVAMLKAKLFQTQCNTPLGRRGKEKGCGPVISGKPRGRKGISSLLVAELKRVYPASAHSKVERAAKGSLRSVIALKCLDCCAMQPKEVALCTLTTCPLWSFRPYKHKESLTEEGRKHINQGGVFIDKAELEESAV